MTIKYPSHKQLRIDVKSVLTSGGISTTILKTAWRMKIKIDPTIPTREYYNFVFEINLHEDAVQDILPQGIPPLTLNPDKYIEDLRIFLVDICLESLLLYRGETDKTNYSLIAVTHHYNDEADDWSQRDGDGPVVLFLITLGV